MAAETKIETLSQNEIRRRGLEALVREFGVVGMTRFLQQFDTGKGDYTRDRFNWLGDEEAATTAAKMNVFQQDKQIADG